MNHATTRLPPQNLDAERSLLGSVLLYGDAFDEITNRVSAEDFYTDPHRKIYEALGRLRECRKPIDAISASEELTRVGVHDEIGGDRYLIQLLESVPHAAHAAYYADIVREKARLRRLIYAAGEMMRDAYDSPLDADSILAAADSTIMDLIGGNRSNEPISAMTGTARFLDDLENRQASVARMSTGFTDVDWFLSGGLPVGSLVILGAGTSIGKSAIAGNIGAHVGRKHHTLIFSLEMPSTEYYSRLITAVSRISLDDMCAAMEAGNTSELIEHSNRAASLQISVDDRSRTLQEVLSRIRWSVRKFGTRLVVVDYLQLVVPADRRAARHEQVGQISGALKAIAMDLGISVLALSQLSRAASEGDIRPQLHHLRESGSLEMDADIVLLLSRNRDSTDAILDVAKHRGGKTGVAKLLWRPEICRFDSAVQEWHSADNYDPLGDM